MSSIPKKGAHFSELKWSTARWTTDWWGLELLSWILAVLLLTTIVVLLASLNGNILPQWSFDITLNTVLSVLAGLFQWSLMVPVIECIGQLKWLWFTQRTRRLLSEFMTFEDACSKPLGAISLLRISRIAHLASLGALITLVAPAFPTVIQQAVSYPLRLKPFGEATLSRCTGFFEIDGSEHKLNKTYLINGMKSSIYNGLYNANITLSDIPSSSFSCPSGNCTWPIHSSLAICASIADLTPVLVTSCSSTNPSSCIYSLPSGGILAGKNEVLSLRPTNGVDFASIAFPHTIPILDVFTFLISNKTGAPVLLEASLNLCVQSFNISASNGKIETTVLDSWHTLNHTQNLVIEVPESNLTFEMGDYSYNSLAGFLQTIFNGTYVVDDDAIAYGSDAIEVLADTIFLEPWDEAVMSTLMEGMATSITNALRTGNWSNKVVGTAFHMVIYVAVQWLWLILPISLAMLTLIFLLATMIRSRSTKLWKTSSLATMQGLSTATHEKLGSLDAATAMEGKIEKMKVELQREGKGWRLVECI